MTTQILPQINQPHKGQPHRPATGSTAEAAQIGAMALHYLISGEYEQVIDADPALLEWAALTLGDVATGEGGAS